MNEEMKKTRERISRRIVPIGLVPVATGTAFLVMGSKSIDSCPGHPSLPLMLLIAGTLTLSLGVMTNVGKFIMAYGIPTDRALTKEEKNVSHMPTFTTFKTFIRVEDEIGRDVMFSLSNVDLYKYKVYYLFDSNNARISNNNSSILKYKWKVD